MTKIYLIRHGDVENPKRLIYGRLGFFKLSELGQKQATELGKYFKDKNISAIYCSPLLRARQTAKAISDGQIPLHYSGLLSEANYIKWQGKPFSARPKSMMDTYRNHPTLLRAGEKLEAIQRRIIKKIFKVLKKHPGQNIIIVSHADPISCARMYFEDKSLDMVTKNKIKKASLTILTFDKAKKCNKVEYREVTYAKEEEL